MAVQRRQEASGFGHLLRRHRTEAGWSQEALAERAGLSARAVSDLERGVKTRPHPATMRLLADALDLSPADRAALAAASRPGMAALATPAPESAPLPVPHTSIVGRSAELTAATGPLRPGTTRLLTLTGPGGVGKTRLSLEIARSVANDFGGAVAFVELAPVADPSLVLPAIAGILDLREEEGRALAEAVRERMRGRRMLLVLDNCEHVLEGVRPVVSDLLGSAPGLAVLATSRSALRLQGEHLLPVPPLTFPDPAQVPDTSNLAEAPAIDLFVQRAQAVRPDFTLTDANIRDVAEICARLDGLPLAIELAAVRIRALSPAALLGLLSDRLRVLTTGPHDAPARQRTLRAAIEWSHDLLAGEHQGYLWRLAVFAGGFTMESAAAVAAEDDPFAALDGLDALLDQGLLQTVDGTDGEQRYRMLETVREFALERLERSGEAETIRTAHARHMIALAEQAAPNLQGPAPRLWLDRLAAEQDNIRAALSWSLGDSGSGGDPEIALRLAAAIWPFWHMRGHLQEGHAWLERAIAQGSRVPPQVRVSAFLELANIANNLEDHRRAEILYRETLGLCEVLGNLGGVAGSLVGLGMVTTSLGDYDRARDHLDQGLGIYLEVGGTAATLPCVYALGRLAMARGDYAEAEARFGEARRLCHAEDIGALTYLSLELAQLERYRGNIAVAGDLAEECLVRFREFGERRAEATNLVEIGHLALVESKHQRAAQCFRDAAASQTELHDEFGLVRSLEGIATLASAKERYDLAAQLTGTTEAWRRRTGTTRISAEKESFGQLTAAAREKIGNEDFDDAWDTGRILTLAQALDAARDVLMASPLGKSSRGQS